MHRRAADFYLAAIFASLASGTCWPTVQQPALATLAAKLLRKTRGGLRAANASKLVIAVKIHKHFF
jgi:hypothetical protein